MYKISTLTVSGTDAFAFLQSQLSNDLLKLDSQESLLSAWCNPKGRVICLMKVSKDGDGYALKVPQDLTSQIMQRLTMFRFRSKVEFDVLRGAENVNLSDTIENGIPWIGLAQTEKFTPHMLNLDLINAINLEKGCFPGQEIVARTHYKGATKRRMMRFESEFEVSVGGKIFDGERDIGEILNAAGNFSLAVVRIDRARDKLTVNGKKLQRRRLPYMQ